MMAEKVMEGNEDTFNAADLLDLLEEFMGRRARWGGDTLELDSGQTIAAVGLFVINVGWILRLDEHRYIRLPDEAVLRGEPIGAEPGRIGSNGAAGDGRRKSKRHGGDRKR